MENKVNIIVPAAGLSSRFPDMKPKYLLYDFDHKLMLQRALTPYANYNIVIGILREHDEKYHASKFIKHEFGDSVQIVILDTLTKGPADTVYQIIKKSNIDLTDGILVKDCDNFFDHTISDGNYVCVSNISEHEILKKLAAKSFIIYNDQDIVTDIIEKKVVSDTFCVGGYKFERAALFVEMFEKIRSTKEVFVSDVIQQCMINHHVFTKKSVTNYVDVGTAEDWFEYNDKPVIFCDIDGTLIINQSRVGTNSYLDDAVPLQNNVNRLLKLQEDGSQFIFTTARPKSFTDQTKKLLDTLGFVNYDLLMGLQNSKRILINDFNKSNPYPRAIAINIKRDSDNLSDFI